MRQQDGGTPHAGPKMPALFVGHGSPMNAIEDNEFNRSWAELGRALPKPNSILCVSAHWETEGTRVTAMETPKTIHDFYGFPRPLYEMRYPAPGSPALAQLVCAAVRKTVVHLDDDWGLDHGAWTVLCQMFPGADIPVVQLSLDRTKDAAFHYALGEELRGLRERGVLVLGSGNIVHNLGLMTWTDTAFDWALECDDAVKRLILSGDHDALIRYDRLGRTARLSIPTSEHFLPLLYILALQDAGDAPTFFTEKVTLGSISMRGVRIG